MRQSLPNLNKMSKKLMMLTLVIVGCTNQDRELVSNNQFLDSEIKIQTLSIEKTAARLGYTKLTLTYVTKSDSVNKYFDAMYATDISAAQANKLKIQQLVEQHTIYKQLISNLYLVDQLEPHLVHHADTTVIFIKCGLEGVLPLVQITAGNLNQSINFLNPMVGKIPTKYLTDEDTQVLLHSPHSSKNRSWDLKSVSQQNK